MNYINKRPLCFTILVVFCLIIIFLIFISFDDNKNINIDEKKIIDSHMKNINIVTNIKINGILGSYDKDNGNIFFSANSFNYKNVKVISPYKSKHYIKKISDKHYTLFVYSSNYYYQYDIYLVNIPLVNIFTFDNLTSDKCDIEFDECSMGITVSDYNVNSRFSSYDVLNSSGKIRVRGTTSAQFEKKSYKIHADKKVKLLGLSSDNDWVLDALYGDPSKIRNKLSSDIWNQINDNQFINNDLGVEFVELFINNEYKGLYTIKNNVDKHVTSLSDSGLLIKSVNHFDHSSINSLKNGTFVLNENGSFLNMEIKQYNENLFNVFLSKMYSYYSNYDDFSNAFDIDNFLNYKVFMALISGDDNTTKNQYYSMRNVDDLILLTPWDMDMTWGLNFSSDTFSYSDEDFNNYNDELWIKYNIINSFSDDSILLLKQHYWKLRKDIITLDNIDSYLNEYKDLLVGSGAAYRDSYRWYDYDIEYEIDEIRLWAKKRIDYLDNYFRLN